MFYGLRSLGFLNLLARVVTDAPNQFVLSLMPIPRPGNKGATQWRKSMRNSRKIYTANGTRECARRRAQLAIRNGRLAEHWEWLEERVRW